MSIYFNQAYYSCLDSIPSLIFIQDKDKQPIFFNQAWLQFTAQTTQNICDSIHLEDREAFERASDDVEFRVKNNQGKYYWVCDYRTRLVDAEERLVGYLNTCYDIQEKKLARERIIAREERYHFAINATGIGVWDFFLTPHASDLLKNKNKLLWNDNMFQMFNVDPNTFEGTYQDFERCVHPDDRGKVEKHIAQCFKTRTILKIQFRLISHPGETRYISAQAKAIFDEKGRPIRLTGINQDVTLAEIEKRELQALHQIIYDREKKYHGLFESSSDAIMLLANNQFVECNDATLLMFDCPNRASFLNSHPSDFSPLKQPDGQSSELLANKHIAHAAHTGKANFSWVHQRLNGEIFPADVLLTSVNLKSQNLIQATVRDTTKLVELQKKLTFLSEHDQLTGLYNRNGLLKPFAEELARSKRYTHVFSILMLDLDYFKQVNDTYGHQWGDKVLVHFARIILSMIRVNDTAVRLGGEEFVVLLPETDRINAKKLAERIRAKIESETIIISQKKQIQYTVSIGVSSYPQNGSDKKSLLEAADKALYLAKESGRNQVAIFEAP
ncbi:MAG: diguanylate cyclase [Legionella sp.]|nr:diguanylate cyclase [Legionella sp.]